MPTDLDTLPARIFDAPIVRDQIVIQKDTEKVHPRLNGRLRSGIFQVMLPATGQGLGWCPAQRWLTGLEIGASLLERALPG
jgi:hypothetical protein